MRPHRYTVSLLFILVLWNLTSSASIGVGGKGDACGFDGQGPVCDSGTVCIGHPESRQGWCAEFAPEGSATTDRSVKITDLFGIVCSSITLIILMTYFAGGYLLCKLFLERKARLVESKFGQFTVLGERSPSEPGRRSGRSCGKTFGRRSNRGSSQGSNRSDRESDRGLEWI